MIFPERDHMEIIWSILYGVSHIHILYILAGRGEPKQTQTSNKPKVRTNLNFEQTQTSNKPESLWP